jgi:cell division protein ZapA (FtsZ GTPase activity inhibitor)
MTQVRSHRVSVLGREFQVKSPDMPEKVAEIEKFVNARLAVVSAAVAGVDLQAVVSLALLNLAGDYLTLVEEYESLQRADSERLNRIINRMDSEVL